MNRSTQFLFAAVAVGLASCATLVPPANRGSLAGTWTMASNTTEVDGKVSNTFGEHPIGQVIFTTDGRYAMVISRDDLPKFASNNRARPTPDEAKAAVAGTIAHYGRYVVDPDGKAVVFHIEGATYPNWNGISQRRPFAVDGDRLQWTTPGASGGGTATLVWKRSS